jgi:hypothetical protein
MRSSRHRRYRLGVPGQASSGHGSRSARNFVAFSPPGLGGQFGRDVVVEDVVVPARDVAGVRPPFVEEPAGVPGSSPRPDEKVDACTRAYERRGEAAKRVADDDNLATVSDRPDDGVGIVPPAGLGRSDSYAGLVESSRGRPRWQSRPCRIRSERSCREGFAHGSPARFSACAVLSPGPPRTHTDTFRGGEEDTVPACER